MHVLRVIQRGEWRVADNGLHLYGRRRRRAAARVQLIREGLDEALP